MEGYSEYLAESAYKVINKKATSNAFIQGVTGIWGFPFNIAVDSVTLFTHYRDMLGKIRSIYGMGNVDDHIASGIMLGMTRELLFDIAFDKALGCVPVLGIYCNFMCAKALTWRLGMVFTILSARGENINIFSVRRAIKIIRLAFPCEKIYQLKKPDYYLFERIVLRSESFSEEEFEQKIDDTIEYYESYDAENGNTDNLLKKNQNIDEENNIKDNTPEDWSDISSLNDGQRNAVLQSVSHNVVLLAGAGSGKTHTLIKRVGYLIAKEGVSPESIVVITFTKKAAEEIKSRMAKVSSNADDIWIGTIHSICVKILSRFKRHIGYEKLNIIDEQEYNRVLKISIFEIIGDCETLPWTVDDFQKKIINYRSAMYKPSDLKKSFESNNYSGIERRNREILIEAYEDFERRLIRTQRIDYDGLILKTIELLSSVKEATEFVHNRFKYIMIDECQDTNDAQFALLRLLGGDNNIMLVGDVNQSIYGFRNAKPELTEEFASSKENTCKMKLEQNYRSTGNIINGANAVISNNKFGTKLKMFTDNEDGEKIHLVPFYGDTNMNRIAREILKLRDKGAKFSDFAIIYRKNKGVQAMDSILKEYRIPHNMVSINGFYTRIEVKVLLSMCMFVYDNADVISFRTILSVYAGVPTGVIDSIIEDSYDRRITLAQALRDYSKKFYRKEIKTICSIVSKRYSKCADLVELIIAYTGKKLVYSKIMDDKEKIESNRVISEFENVIDNMQRNMSDEDSYIEKLRELYDRTETDGIEDDRIDYDSVKIMTAHGAKGLEFNVVFIADANKDYYPISRIKSISGSRYNRIIEYERVDFEEERRLFYVAMTRAKKLLYIVYDYHSPSMYIKEIPEKYCDEKVI